MLLSNKKVLFWTVLIVLIVTTFFVLYFQRNPGFSYKKGASSEFDRAVIAAMDVYKKGAKNMDLSNGPCLTNDLIPGWVADIVHNPRDETDDLPANQCPAYLEGRAQHFVELDQNGNVVRVK